MVQKSSNRTQRERRWGPGSPGPLRLARNRLLALYEISTGKGGYYSEQERNIALLYLDIAAASVLSAAMSFNSAFALRLGASNTLIGLMTSLPALVTMLGMIPASAIVERQARRWPPMWQSINVTRLLFIPVAFIPWLVPAAYQAVALVTILTLRFLTILVFSAGWDAVLADIVPPGLRAQVFSWRNIISTAAVAGSLLLMQPWLQWAPFPLNYQVMFFVGGVAGMVSVWFLSRLKVPETTPVVPPQRRRGLPMADMRELLVGHPEYRRMVVNTLLANAGPYLASPVYIIYYVRTLSATDGWIATSTLVSNVATMLGYFAWRRILPRLGESRALRATWPICGLLPVALGLSGSLNLVLVVLFIYGLVQPGLNLSHYNTLLEVCPKERRPTYISVYSSVVNVLAFVLPMAGVALADLIGLAETLVLCGVLWIAGGLSFSIFRVRVADTSVAPT